MSGERTLSRTARFFPSVHGLPRAFWVLWAGTLVNRVGGFVVPFLALYLTEQRRFSTANAGFVVALFGAGSLAAGPVGGVLADRVGRRPTLILGLGLGAVAMLHLGLSRSLVHIAIATLLLGFVGDLYRPAVSASIADLIPSEDRARAYGLLHWAVNIGFSIAPVVAGAMAGHAFIILFAGDAATTLVFAVIVALFIRETRPSKSVATETQSKPAVTQPPYRDGLFMALVATTLVLAWVFFQFTAPLPLDMAKRGITPKQFGSLMAINGVLIVLFQPISIQVLGRYRRERVLALSALLVGVGFGSSAFAHSVPAYAATVVIWTFGEITNAPVSQALVADVAPADRRGAYQGAFQLAFGGAAFLGPAIGGWMLERFDASILWASCLLGGVIAAMGYWIVGSRLRERSMGDSKIAEVEAVGVSP